MQNNYKIVNTSLYVSGDLHVFEQLNIGMYIYMKLTHTKHPVQVLCLFSFYTHTQVTIGLSGLLKRSEKTVHSTRKRSIIQYSVILQKRSQNS